MGSIHQLFARTEETKQEQMSCIEVLPSGVHLRFVVTAAVGDERVRIVNMLTPAQAREIAELLLSTCDDIVENITPTVEGVPV